MSENTSDKFIGEDQYQEENEPQSKGTEFPPETARLLSWSSLRFIRAPSSRFLFWSVIAIAITCVVILFLSNLIQMDVTVRAPGDIVSDFGSRDAITQSQGQITEIKKKIDDHVEEGEVIAMLMMDAETETEIIQAVDALQNLEKRIRVFQSSNEFDFSISDLPSVTKIEAGLALDAVISLEQQAKFFMDLRVRSRKGVSAELQPLRRRAQLLEGKINKIKESKQKQMLGLYLESTEDELGKIRSQISSTESEAKLKLEQGLGEFLKSIQAAEGALRNYLSQRQVKAPIKGTVAEIYAKINTTIEANKPIAKIVPENSRYMAAMYVYSKDIVKINAGQTVLYKVEAYPYQTYGSFTGNVISFEQTKGEAAANGEYTVYGTVEFPKHLTPELRNKMRLIVGMKLNSDIVIDRKSGASIMKKLVFEKQ